MDVWFNPRCSNCRIAKEALDEAGLTYNLRYYLEEPPSAEELARVLDQLHLQPWEICRTADAAKAGIDVSFPRAPANRSQWIDLLVKHPDLIQRPLVVTDDGEAWVARDPDTLEEVLKHVSA